MNATKRERKLRYLRGLRGEKKHAAVSPVVATLILILIAVAAAAALYLWLVAWQGNITGGIGQPGAQSTVSIGGSTSMQQFDQDAITWFEQNNSDISISNNGGGTGAGLLAMCGGHIDVAAATTPETAALLQANDGCPATPGITVTTIAYDAVDVIVQGANPHGLLSINHDTLLVIYDHASTSTPTLVATTLDGNALPTGYPAGGVLAWDQIPAAVQGATIGALGIEQAESAGAGAGGAPCAAPYGDDICAGTFGTTATPCGWSVCAGGTVAAPATNTIVAVERSDAAGASTTLEAKLFGATSSSAVAASFTALGYSGCGSNNLLSDCGINVAQSESGDAALQNYVAGNPNALGYGSDGLARVTVGIGAAGIIPFASVGQVNAAGVPQAASGFPVTTGSSVAYNAIVPTTTSGTGTIAAGIVDSATLNQYTGWRPFEFITLQPPTGEVQRFIQFVVDPANNAALAAQTGEVGLYQV
jgi:ABC-type phosphate transport system substrate-binding protein